MTQMYAFLQLSDTVLNCGFKTILSFHSSIDEPKGCFPRCSYYELCLYKHEYTYIIITDVFNSYGQMPSRGIAELNGISSFSAHSSILAYIPPQCRVPFPLRPHQHLPFDFLMIAFCSKIESWYYFNLHFFNVELLSCICISSEKWLFQKLIFQLGFYLGESNIFKFFTYSY